MRLGNKPVKQLIEDMEREGVNAFVEALAEEFATLHKRLEALEKRVRVLEEKVREARRAVLLAD